MCTVPGCGAPVRRRGLCYRHLREAEPLPAGRPRIDPEMAAARRKARSRWVVHRHRMTRPVA